MDIEKYRKSCVCQAFIDGEKVRQFPDDNCCRCAFNENNIPGYTKKDAECAVLYRMMHSKGTFEDAQILSTLKRGRRTR